MESLEDFCQLEIAPVVDKLQGWRVELRVRQVCFGGLGFRRCRQRGRLLFLAGVSLAETRPIRGDVLGGRLGGDGGSFYSYLCWKVGGGGNRRNFLRDSMCPKGQGV